MCNPPGEEERDGSSGRVKRISSHRGYMKEIPAVVQRHYNHDHTSYNINGMKTRCRFHNLWLAIQDLFAAQTIYRVIKAVRMNVETKLVQSKLGSLKAARKLFNIQAAYGNYL